MTERQKEKLRDEAKQKGKQLIEVGPGDPVLAEVHIGGNLIVIASQAGLRTVAKIAYVGLAYLFGITFAVSDAFNDVRRFISEGKPEGIASIFINQSYLAANQQGPHQHLIAIAGRRDKHRVDAIVRLFGELTYFVVLSDHYDGVDFCNTLIYDAYRGEKGQLLFGNVQAELLQTDQIATDKETLWNDLQSFSENFCAFIERVVEEKRLRDLAANGTV